VRLTSQPDEATGVQLIRTFRLGSTTTHLSCEHTIAPGASASYTEHWYLLPHAFPAAGESIDLEKLAAQVERDAR